MVDFYPSIFRTTSFFNETSSSNVSNKNDENEELLKYILQYYQNKNNMIPKIIYVPAGIDRELLMNELNTTVHTPQRGEKKHLLDLAGKRSFSIKTKIPPH